MTKSELENKLKDVVVSFTDQCYDHMTPKPFIFLSDRAGKTIYLSTRDYSYTEYMQNLYECVMGKKKNFFKIKKKDRNFLYNLYEKNKYKIESCQRHSIWE